MLPHNPYIIIHLINNRLLPESLLTSIHHVDGLLNLIDSLDRQFFWLFDLQFTIARLKIHKNIVIRELVTHLKIIG